MMKKYIQFFVLGLFLITFLPSFTGRNPIKVTNENDSLNYKKSHLVDYDAFEKLVQEVKQHRQKRLLSWDDFKEKSKEDNTIILDTRSKKMYDYKHVKGAIHLNFADFNQFSLDSITNQYNGRNTQILIYCNNNFEDKGNEILINDLRVADIDISMMSKVVIPERRMQEIRQSRTPLPIPNNDLTLALNIPTYINLYGYGYRNVYELGELIDVKDERIEFEGTFNQ